jgi:hypothetical protein
MVTENLPTTVTCPCLFWVLAHDNAIILCMLVLCLLASFSHTVSLAAVSISTVTHTHRETERERERERERESSKICSFLHSKSWPVGFSCAFFTLISWLRERELVLNCQYPDSCKNHHTGSSRFLFEHWTLYYRK